MAALSSPASPVIRHLPEQRRFELEFESEELRQKWVASATHMKVWPPMENMLRTKDYTVVLFDVQA